MEEETVLVGAALGPDNYPGADLEPGDNVRLIELSGNTSSDGVTFATGGDIAVGEIVEVRTLGSDNLHFSIRIGESSATRVVNRIASNQLSIALLEDPSDLDPMEPLAAEDIPMDDDDMEDSGDDG